MRHRIVDTTTVSPTGNDAVRSQPSQLLRHNGLVNGQAFLQFTDGLFAFGEKADDRQPEMMGKSAKEDAGFPRSLVNFMHALISHSQF